MSEGPSCSRVETIFSLLRTIPWQGKVESEHAMGVLSHLARHGTKSLKTEATSSITTLSSTHPKLLEGHAGSLLAMIKEGGHDDLVYAFMGNDKLYKSDPEGFHEHLDVFLEQDFTKIASILYSVSQANPEALIPFVDKIVDEATSGDMMSGMAITILPALAVVAPEVIFDVLGDIKQDALDQPSGDLTYARIIGGCLKGGDTAMADQCVDMLIEILDSDDVSEFAPATVISEISNAKTNVSSVDVIARHMDVITRYRSSCDDLIHALEDFCAGRSLEKVEDRLDDLEKMVGALNSKVSEACTNFADVKAYVDKNISEVKDFVGEIVKKLPQPGRLEVCTISFSFISSSDMVIF